MTKWTDKEMQFHLQLMRLHFNILKLLIIQRVTSRVVKIFQH